VLKRVRRSAGPLSRYPGPSFVMTWVSLTKLLELAHDILAGGDVPNVSEMTYEKKKSIRLRFRDGIVSFDLVPVV